MQRLPIQLSVSALLIVVFGVALNVWLFRFGALAGILGLSVTKHVVIAWLCRVLGVDREARADRRAAVVAGPRAVVAVAGPVAAPLAPPAR